MEQRRRPPLDEDGHDVVRIAMVIPIESPRDVGACAARDRSTPARQPSLQGVGAAIPSPWTDESGPAARCERRATTASEPRREPRCRIGTPISGPPSPERSEKKIIFFFSAELRTPAAREPNDALARSGEPIRGGAGRQRAMRTEHPGHLRRGSVGEPHPERVQMLGNSRHGLCATWFKRLNWLTQRARRLR
jgi:hypothetical protein